MYQMLSVEKIEERGHQAVRFNVGSSAAMLDVKDVDALIETLGRMRSALSPSPPTEPSLTHEYPIEIDPCWYIDTNPLFDGVVLLLRHTGLGWTGFAIPQASLERLQEAIVRPVQHSFEVSRLPS
ncbi:hypothetical protein [Caballeronia sp.]|uniref:hypothetical protein n=1 Tax=Caballeronia sp. TaxID=1931223 RepID=UPI003C42BBAB